MILRVESIAGSRLNVLELEKADLIISPDVGRKYWSDFSGLEALITEGVIAAETSVDEIRKLLSRARRGAFWKRLSTR